MDESARGKQAKPARPIERPRWVGGRIEILRELGAGGMGIVYEALDRERNTRVAVKTLQRMHPDALVLFKREFRALQDIHHENLVQYGELFEEEGMWFFTMELLTGKDLYEHVCGGSSAAAVSACRSAATVDDRARASGPVARGSGASERPPSRPPGVDHAFDEGRLRESFGQLVRGLDALHAAKKVHRDVKPANVIVDRGERVVVLDFGVVGSAQDDRNAGIVGTPLYMAPEQALGERLGPAADWYALGATLYLVLTGRTPYVGPDAAVLAEKLERPPERPTRVNPRVPPDLDALCMDLLALAPEARPKAPEIQRRIGGAPVALAASAAVHEDVFVGRARELGALRAAFERSRNGQVSTCVVHGVSGVGKTAIVEAFLRELRAAHPGAVVLSGRCYEREVVPYKAVDEVIDALAAHLAGAPDEEVEELVPPETGLLARVFPVLTTVPAFAAAAARGTSAAPADPQQMRGRVFGALRALVGALAARRRIVVTIDDLQWADADSLALLAEVLRAPDPPPLLLVATVRTSAEGAEQRTVTELSQRLAQALTEVHAPPLSQEESVALALAMAGDAAPALGVSAESVAAETGGHPLFIAELIRHRAKHGGGGAHLDDVIWSRASALEDSARRLLEIVAIAGVPIRQDVAAEVAGLTSSQMMTIAAALRASRLVRTSGPGVEDSIEPYHDRVRETVVGRSDAEEKKRLHRRLAVSLEAHGKGDAEMLALHWGAAGERAKALGHCVDAAERAMRVLAFDRAAQLYARAIELVEGDPDTARGLLLKHAEALSNAGRCAEAAADFSALAGGAPHAETQEMNRRAALEYFKSGHVDEGLDRVRLVLAAIGLRMAPNLVLALVSILLRRAYLRLRGFGFQPRREEDIPAPLRERIDVTWTVSLGLMTTELFHAADFLTRNMLLSLQSGSRSRIARALGMMVGQMSIEGTRVRRRIEDLVSICYALAEDQPSYVRAWAQAGHSCAEYSVGEWAKARALSAAAAREFVEQSIGSSFERNNLLMFHLWSLYYLGEMRELSTQTRALLESARQRGDQFFEHFLRTGFPLTTWLAADEPGEARKGLEAMLQRWSRRGFHAQHWWGLTGAMLTELYEGAPDAAYARLCAQWGALQRSLLPRMQNVRIEAWDLRARGALALARRAAHPAPLLRAAARDAKRIERERIAWAAPMAGAIRAALDWRRGDRSRALARLASAADGFRAAGMGLYAAATQRRLGELSAGEAGAELVRAADAWMRGQGIEDPARMTGVFAPVF